MAKKTVAVDFSALERQVLAHFGVSDVEDPYVVKAAEMFGIPKEQVTPEQRFAAKRELFLKLYENDPMEKL